MAATDIRAERLSDVQASGWNQPRIAPAADKAKILIVDDDERNVFSLRRILEELDQTVVSVGSGEDALRCLLREEFAVILLDVLLPGMDGYETAAVIRQREKSRHIPIIFLTAVNKDEVHMFRGYSAGAVDYVFKPVEPLVLRSKVSVFIELFRKTQEIRRKADLERRLLAEKMLAEQALRRSEERQAVIIQSLPIVLYAANAVDDLCARRHLSGNVAGICGFPAMRFAQDPDLWAGRIHPEDREQVLRQFSGLVESSSVATEYRWQCADGAYRIFLDQAVLVRDDNGHPTEIFGSWLDVTERRRLEQQLVHAQKLEAIGRLTGGIAHDFNNMLTIIIGSLDQLRRSVDGDERLRRRIEMALQGALRCSDLTKRLLAFARRQALQPQPVDINDLVSQMADMLRRILGELIEIDIRCASELWIARADPSQVESALVNLAINARDAMSDGGRLIIETANVHVTEEDAAQEPETAAGDYVMIAVTDTGTGIPTEVLNRVFEPFFTTKSTGHGTGLGLSITYGFVKQSGGHIKIETEVDRGTTIRLYLPRGGPPKRVKPTHRRSDAALPRARKGEVVLAVEDDYEVRRLTASILQELGYDVLEAENGCAALRILAQEVPVHLLFTDVVMPGGLCGPELAAEAVRRRPGLKVLFTSAYTDQSTGGAAISELGDLLRKPYRDHEIAHAVRSALDG